MLYCDFVKSVRAGGLAQVGAKVLLADLGNGAVLAQLIDSLVQSFAQGGGFIALAHRESNLGSDPGSSVIVARNHTFTSWCLQPKNGVGKNSESLYNI